MPLCNSPFLSQAPELFNGTRVDEKCDVFSLGGILYECYTGRVPFEELSRGAQASMGLFQVLLLYISALLCVSPHHTKTRPVL